MMAVPRCLCLMILVRLIPCLEATGCELFNLQAEAFKTEGKVVQDAQAAGRKAVHLEVGQKHKLSFCLQRETEVALQQIRYLNSGEAKSLVVHIDGTYIDVVHTRNTSNCAKLRDKYNAEREIGDLVTLARGRHIIRFKVTSGDSHGLAIDMVTLRVKDPDLNFDTFTCKSFCNSEIPFPPSLRKGLSDATSPVMAVQKSYRTECAEADNVKIFLYHPHVRKYKIRARHPLYHTLANKRKPDFTSCEFSSNLLWELKDVRFQKKKVDHADKNMTLETRVRNNIAREVTVTFRLKGRDAGMNDPDVGNTFSLSLTNVVSRITVSALLLGKNKEFKPLGRKYAGIGNRGLTWNIPDYAWANDTDNKLKVVLSGKDVRRVNISSIKLEKRWLKGDESFKIFDDDNVVVEGVTVDMWWLKDAITISVEGSDREWKAHYFRFYFPVPWTKGFSQVFVMYQDGNVRLLPTSPHGADWIPFGSSVLIGQMNASALRPAAEIGRVHITPDSSEITVYYVDGGLSLITLDVTMEETIANVKILRLGMDPELFPFVSFRSMWVKDGNSDVDHVSANGLQGRHILDKWDSLYGYSFTFYRQCISEHNTQSPDINIEIVE